jgi:hypothetical protein
MRLLTSSPAIQNLNCGGPGDIFPPGPNHTQATSITLESFPAFD